MCSIYFILTLASAITALPQNADPSSKDPGLPTAQGVHRIWVSKSCTNDEQLQISEAFYDAGRLANALKTWEPTGKNQDAMDMYMGTKSTWDGDPFWPFGHNYVKIMKNNIIRSASVYEDYGLTDNDLYLECHKSIYNSEADCAKLGPDTHAGTWNNPGYYWTDHYMVFCPGFFTSPRMSDDIAKAKDGTYDTRTIDNFQRSKGATFFHESFHLDYTVGKPPIFDQGPDGEGVYGPTAVYDVAEKSNAGATMIIAEAYMMAGIAIYLRDTLGLTTLPRPAERGGVAANINDNPPVRTAIKLPDNFRGATDPNDSNSKPSSNDWNKLFGSDDSQVQAEEQQLGQPARCRTETERTSNTAYVLSDGVTQSSIHGIALLLREVLCNDRCELPKAITDEHARVTPTDDGNGCEISVAIPNSVEIYLYRKMHAQDMAVQRCWDYTKVLFNTCLIRGANAGDGWVDGDQQNEFYQGGMRKINDPASFAVKAGNPLDTDKTLQFAPTSPGGQGK